MLAKSLSLIPPDAIFELTKFYNANESANKVNLGQGTYKDENGNPYILRAVAAAKQRIAKANHEYLPILGLPAFREQAVRLLFGDGSTAVREQRIAVSQSLSGTGALHLAGSFLRRTSGACTTVYITEPSWSNHRDVFETVGFHVEAYQYLDVRGRFDFCSLIATMQRAAEGSIFVLHACAHNPSGCDPSPEQWMQLASIMKERKLLPLFDAAYLGLTTGRFDDDAFAIRYFEQEAKMEIGVCLSFAKNMGLYGERVGAVAFVTQSEQASRVVESHLAQIQRFEISNPPAFGARIVSEVLSDKELRSLWEDDLRLMSKRLASMRQKLFNELSRSGCSRDLSHICEQVGMFCILGLDRSQVLELRDKYHIYMADSSRISIAGLNDHNVVYVARAIEAVVR